jgi:hypothetical protein
MSKALSKVDSENQYALSTETADAQVLAIQ